MFISFICWSILNNEFQTPGLETKEFLSSLGDKHCVLDAALTAIISPHLWQTLPNVISRCDKIGLLPWGDTFVDDYNRWPLSGLGAGLWANARLRPSRWFWNGPMGMTLMMMIGTCGEETKLVLHEFAYQRCVWARQRCCSQCRCHPMFTEPGWWRHLDNRASRRGVPPPESWAVQSTCVQHTCRGRGAPLWQPRH